MAALGRKDLELTLQALTVLAEAKDVVIPAGGAKNLPKDEGVRIDGHKLKTISFWGDWTGLKYFVQASDDGTFTDYPSLYDGTLTANVLESPTFEADFGYVRVRVENPDTVDHMIRVFRVKGRKL